MASKKQFDRWNPREKTSHPYTIYASYSGELRKMYRAMCGANKYVYSSLKSDRKATWTDDPEKIFVFPTNVKLTRAVFNNLKDWSNSFNEFGNWANLNVLVSICGIFETYLVHAITLALKSDIGLRYGLSKQIDGIRAVKAEKKFSFSQEVESCTKGDWSKRISAINSIFGSIPKEFEDHIGDLEKIRKLRNGSAHAFGRNIEKAQDIFCLEKVMPESLKSDMLRKYWDIIDNCVKAFDHQLNTNHIGEFRLLVIYHDMEAEILKSVPPKNLNIKSKAKAFRKMYGSSAQIGSIALGKEFAEGLVTYYDSL